jgi:hypothetical protein
MIKSEVRSLLILNLVITPSLISERPLTIVSFEVLINTANGVDLINIANPNSVGVSINHYKKFNVGTDWLMLQKCIAVLLLFTLKRVIWGQMIKKLKIVFIF